MVFDKVTLREALDLYAHVKIDPESPSMLAWRARSGKGKENKREGEPAGGLNRTGGRDYRVMVNGKRWTAPDVIKILTALFNLTTPNVSPVLYADGTPSSCTTTYCAGLTTYDYAGCFGFTLQAAVDAYCYKTVTSKLTTRLKQKDFNIQLIGAKMKEYTAFGIEQPAYWAEVLENTE